MKPLLIDISPNFRFAQHGPYMVSPLFARALCVDDRDRIAAGVLKMIPSFGPVVVCVGTGLVAFLQFGTINMMLLVSGLSLLITSL